MGGESINIYYHKTCPTSVKLIELLNENDLLRKVNLIDVEERPFLAISKGIISVPAIEINGELIDFGPIDFDYVINRIRGDAVSLRGRDVLKELKRIILDNLFFSISVFLHEDIRVILDHDHVLIKLGFNREAEEELKGSLIRDNKGFYQEIEEKLLKVISINLLRELKWLGNLSKDEFSKKYDLTILSHWLISRGSIARVGLIIPKKRDLVKRKAAQLREYILRNWDYLLGKI